MSDRLEAAVRELADALLEELRQEGAPTRADRLLSIPEVAERLGIGRTSVYAELGAGRLRQLRVGRRVLIPESAVFERMRGATAVSDDAPEDRERASAPTPTAA